MSPLHDTAKEANGSVSTVTATTPLPTAVVEAKRRGRPPRAIEASAPAPTKPPRPPLTPTTVAGKASPRARQVAAVVLEVLAGQRTPTQAAQELEIVPVRYYQLETRALAGLLTGCEPAVRGRQAASPDEQQMKAECERLRQEAARSAAELTRVQTLIRTARSAFGLRPPAPPATVKPGKDGRPGRQRKPRVRALRLAKLLKPETAATPTPAGSTTSVPAGG